MDLGTPSPALVPAGVGVGVGGGLSVANLSAPLPYAKHIFLNFTTDFQDAVASTTFQSCPPSTLNLVGDLLASNNLYHLQNVSDPVEVFQQLYHTLPRVLPPACRDISDSNLIVYWNALRELENSSSVLESYSKPSFSVDYLSLLNFTTDCATTTVVGNRLVQSSDGGGGGGSGLGTQDVHKLINLSSNYTRWTGDQLSVLRNALPSPQNQYLNATISAYGDGCNSTAILRKLGESLKVCVLQKRSCSTINVPDLGGIVDRGLMLVFGFIAGYITLAYFAMLLIGGRGSVNRSNSKSNSSDIEQQRPSDIGQQRAMSKSNYVRTIDPRRQYFVDPRSGLEIVLVKNLSSVWDAVLVLTMTICIAMCSCLHKDSSVFFKTMLNLQYAFTVSATFSLFTLHMFKSSTSQRLLRLALQLAIFCVGCYLAYHRYVDISFDLDDPPPAPDSSCWNGVPSTSPWPLTWSSHAAKAVLILHAIVVCLGEGAVLVLVFFPFFGLVMMWVVFGMMVHIRNEATVVFGDSYHKTEFGYAQILTIGFFFFPILAFIFDVIFDLYTLCPSQPREVKAADRSTDSMNANADEAPIEEHEMVDLLAKHAHSHTQPFVRALTV